MSVASLMVGIIAHRKERSRFFSARCTKWYKVAMIMTMAAVRCSPPRTPTPDSHSSSGFDHQLSGYFKANPVNTSVGKLTMMPQCAMRNHRFIRSTTSPDSLRGFRRTSFTRRSSKLCSAIKPSVTGISTQYVQRIHFTTG